MSFVREHGASAETTDSVCLFGVKQLSQMTAKIAVENTAYSFDKLYDYLIPDSLALSLKVGCRVLVDFGRSSKKRQGFVVEISPYAPDGKIKLKSVSAQSDKEPLLSEELVKLGVWLSERTFCPLYDCIKSLLPSGMYLKVKETFRSSPVGVEKYTYVLDESEAAVLDFLIKKDDFVEKHRIYKKTGVSEDTKAVDKLYEKKLLLRNVDTRRVYNGAAVKTVMLREQYVPENSIPMKITKKQQDVVDFLRTAGAATSKEIAYYTGVTQSVAESLHNMGFVTFENERIFRTPYKAQNIQPDAKPITLSAMQENAYEKLRKLTFSEKAEAALLFGVTGSGKTKVYMKLIDDMVKSGAGAIVLVPEIALTPQLLTMFYARYGKRTAVLHSALAVGERTDEWQRIKNGEANIVVGTRSAVFAPVENLKLIVIDEEQESAYKSEMSPRYNAKDAARFRCAYNKALLLLSSATPSVESFAAALSGRYELIELTERYSGLALPKVTAVDVSQKENMNGRSTISVPLADEIRENLKNHKQTILLINRRGFHTFVACSECKSVVTCPRCSISLTYHAANERLMCHYCGYSEPVSAVCPSCGAERVRFSGYGTQLVEQELNELFPEAKVLRMDADTTSFKNSHEICFESFARGEYDILLGTQMVAKGLDFPRVTLVGVISVDQQLYNDDYKSAERTFDLLTQVVGRSGRNGGPGRAIIQTLAPENYIIELAAEQDYRSFFNTEIAIRKGLTYPPYCDICAVCLAGSKEYLVKNAAGEFFRLFRDKVSEKYSDEKVMVLGPAPPKVAKVNNCFRERLIIKCKNTSSFRALISECLKDFSTNKQYNKIKVYADINPESLY